MNTRLPDALRAELADKVERTLAPDLDLHALAREMNDATGAIRTCSWIRAHPATLEQVIEVSRTLLPITDHEADLTLLTAGDGSPVYMRRWWLRRRPAGDGRGQDGLYVHVFENDDPEGFHNHPWPSASLLLCGGPIFEDNALGTATIETRDIVLRPAAHRHRIRLHRSPENHDESGGQVTAMTLFCTGRRVQGWGFEQPDGSIEPIADRRESTRAAPRRHGSPSTAVRQGCMNPPERFPPHDPREWLSTREARGRP